MDFEWDCVGLEDWIGDVNLIGSAIQPTVLDWESNLIGTPHPIPNPIGFPIGFGIGLGAQSNWIGHPIQCQILLEIQLDWESDGVFQSNWIPNPIP